MLITNWKIRLPFLLSTWLLYSNAAQAAADTYEVDQAHSSITFQVRHFFSPVPGNFSDFQATIQYDPENPANNSAKAVINVKSVDTNNEKRDGHLNSEDFFHSGAFPQITFQSTNWEPAGENKFNVTGDITIRDVTKPVVLDVTLLGAGDVGKGKYISGWMASTTLKRTDFGVDYGVLSVIGDDVSIEITVEAVRQ